MKWSVSNTILTILLINVLAVNSFSREKVALAVMDFTAKNVTQSSAEAVTDLLRTELFNTGSFRVIERQQIRRLIEEQRLQMSGLTDTDQVVEIGRMLNVNKIMIGSVTKLGNTHIVNTRIVDVQSGLVELAEAKESRGGEEMLPRAIAELAVTISFKVGLEGAIIRIDEREIFFDLGIVDGIRLGQVFDVLRQGEVITDLEGHVIGSTTETIGKVVVAKVQDRFSVASVQRQVKMFRKGDKVKPAVDQELVEPVIEPAVKKEAAKRKKKKDDEEIKDIPTIF